MILSCYFEDMQILEQADRLQQRNLASSVLESWWSDDESTHYHNSGSSETLLAPTLLQREFQ